MSDDVVTELLVPCPRCGEAHKVQVKDARENARVTLPCGTVIGSAGILNRLRIKEEAIRRMKEHLHQL